MSFEKLKKLLNFKDQKFTCSPAGGLTGLFDVNISHESQGAVSAELIDSISKEYGVSDELLGFYGNYGSLRLFCDKVSGASAFYMAHPDEWSELKKELNEWLDQVDEDGIVPDWVESMVVFGEMPETGNYYMSPLAGSEKHKVYCFDHDGFEFVEVSSSFDEFINKISDVTDSLVEHMQSYVRYSDGKTDMQWIPEKFSYSE